MDQNIIIKKDTAKRLIKDIKQIKNEPIDGIHYIHDETNMLQGYGLIIGPPDTPYEGGYYLFLFEFPSNYPFSPPKLKYFTNDGNTRMHPNLYKNGKVCLSILNTWSGESWTGCQTISSVLLTIRSIMTTDPLLHEPGIDKYHRDFLTYTEIIRYKNIEVAMKHVLKCDDYNVYFRDLINIAKRDFIENFDKKMEISKNSQQMFINFKNESDVLYTSVYNMQCNIDYVTVICDLEKLRDILTKKMKE